MQIADSAGDVYQVPSSVFPRPDSSNYDASNSDLEFSYKDSPFSFAITRKSSGDVLFDTTGSPLIFETQYLRLRTSLPDGPNLYGLGEHSDSFRLNTSDYTRTLWSRDAYGIPQGTNLYGNHPVYYDNRGPNATHAVFLLNSNGMDIKINNSADAGQYLEYNTNGGIVDLYFMAGPSPIDAVRQYSEVAGKAAMMPYWGLGLHQCRYGYQDYIDIAEVIYNYSKAEIPLETMWTDIDYMDLRKVFTQDTERFPSTAVRDYVQYLHDHDQHYVVMQDPAVAFQNYSGFLNGNQKDVFLHNPNGSLFNGVVWPGVTVFPDWFAPNTQDYWNSEFVGFFNNETGFDIDALWIDMNEPSNFGCPWPCSDPFAAAAAGDFPPAPPPLRTPPRPIPGFPAEFQPVNSSGSSRGDVSRREAILETSYPSLSTGPHRHRPRQSDGSGIGLPGRDLINPPYAIQNAAGSLSNMTVNTNIIHANGYAEYDTHNLYGTMMSSASRAAMLARRPTLRPMVITRSTFAGAGTQVGHWLGDNFSIWAHYRNSIQGMLNFASLFQVPMVGSDVCGYAQDTNANLCARWAMLGAFYPFYRNHNALGTIGQEFYRWPVVASAAKAAIDVRYRLLDYLYTAMHAQSVDGTPLLNPLFFLYPSDAKTYGIDLQWFFGDAVLVSPVTEENATAVDIYLPDDQFYDLWTYTPVRGTGATISLTDIAFDYIPLHIRGGAVIPFRNESAMTTAEVRRKSFDFVVAPGLDGVAEGALYLDDGVSLEQAATTEVGMAFSGGTLRVSGTFGYTAESPAVATVTFLGQSMAPEAVPVNGKAVDAGSIVFDAGASTVKVVIGLDLTEGFEVAIG